MTFLSEAVHLSDATNQCVRSFTKTKAGDFTKDSIDSLFRLKAAALASVLGHFETYQRFLFGGVLEATRLIPSYSINESCRRLEKDSGLSIDLPLATAYRGQPAPIGQLIADNLRGWHDPERVNGHFRALVPEVQFYSKSEAEELRVLWQLRHSIVHTGGWLTQPDAQKVKSLRGFGNMPVLLDGHFVEVCGRRLHPIVKGSVGRLEARFTAMLPTTLNPSEQKEVDSLFEVKSRRTSWFR